MAGNVVGEVVGEVVGHVLGPREDVTPAVQVTPEVATIRVAPIAGAADHTAEAKTRLIWQLTS